MAKRRNMNDWLSTKTGKAAAQAIAMGINNLEMEEEMTKAEVDRITKVTQSAMSLAYDGGYLDGYDHASLLALSASKAKTA